MYPIYPLFICQQKNLYYIRHKPAGFAHGYGNKKGMVSEILMQAETIPRQFNLSGKTIFLP
jgi:hypothetical protein